METATLDGITATSASESQESILASLQPEGQPETGATEPKAAEPEPTPAAAPKKPSSYQSRIDSLSAELANKDQAIGALNQRLSEVEELKRQIAALRAPKQDPQQPQQPAEDAEPQEDQFDTYAAFVKAQAAYVVRQERKAWEQDQARRQHIASRQQSEAALKTAFDQRIEAAKTSIPNFDAVLNDRVMLSAPMQDAIFESEIGPQLMAHFHEHHDDAERIFKINSYRQAFKEMNKLEARLEGAVSSGPPPKAKPVSAAKPPIKPLGAANSTVTDDPPGDDATAEEHFRYWDRKEAEAYARR